MVNQSDIEILYRFIPALVHIHHELQIENFKSEQSHLRKLFAGLNEINQRKLIYIKEHAPYFNIFQILRYGHYETRLHTPFLVHLLSPDGHHQLENQFFKLFIDTIFNKSFEISEFKKIEVNEEFQATGLEGRIDIYIRFLYKTEIYLVAIENKINAYDQEAQLSRYFDYLIKKGIRTENIRLIYLTKFGDKPSIPYSIEEEEFNRLQNEGILKLVSYKTNISEMINRLLQRKNPNAVNEVLKQYLSTINSI